MNPSVLGNFYAPPTTLREGLKRGKRINKNKREIKEKNTHVEIRVSLIVQKANITLSGFVFFPRFVAVFCFVGSVNICASCSLSFFFPKVSRLSHKCLFFRTFRNAIVTYTVFFLFFRHRYIPYNRDTKQSLLNEQTHTHKKTFENWRRY